MSSGDFSQLKFMLFLSLWVQEKKCPLLDLCLHEKQEETELALLIDRRTEDLNNFSIPVLYVKLKIHSFPNK